MPPLRVPEPSTAEVIKTVAAKAPPVPLWCLWPLPAGWMVTGAGWVGDDRGATQATVLSCSGPVPVRDGPADALLIAESPGVGLGTRFAGIPGLDPGPRLQDRGPLAHAAAHAKVKAAGWPTPLWAVESAADRGAYVGEAKGMWLWVVTWPELAGYLLLEDVVLRDLTDWVPPGLVYGAPSPYLHGKA